MSEALLHQSVIDHGDGTIEITETWDLSHPDCPIDVINQIMNDDDVFVSVVCNYLSEKVLH